ncbi:MAG: hypothetical protein LUE20_06110 [Oscillospiraceae bacterium]|nr:hypothetical protein [Oscillospiraceae bacterium]
MGRKRLDHETKAERYRQQKSVARKKYYAKTAHLYPRHAWTEEEIEMVLAHSIPDSELSVKLGRSLKGIQEKRRRLKNAEANTPKPEQ